jgi:hypothetical protein
MQGVIIRVGGKHSAAANAADAFASFKILCKRVGGGAAAAAAPLQPHTGAQHVHELLRL